MNDKESKNLTSILVWLCITAFYCYQYILRTLPNIIMPDIMSTYGVGSAEIGSFSGVYYVVYIIVHIPIGVLLSRFGAKIVLPICIVCTAIGLIPLVYFDQWWIVVLGRAFTGIGSSAAAVGALQMFRILYPDKFARVLGMTVSLGLVTTVYVGTLLSESIQAIGLNSTINVLLYLGIGLAIPTYLLIPKSTNQVSHNNVWSDIKGVICNYKLLLTSMFAGLMVGPLEGFADAWGSAFIITVHHIEKITADSIVFSILLGMCAGCIILPYVADKTKSYFGTAIFSAFAMAGCFIYMLIYRDLSVEALYITCIIVGIFSAYQIIMISKIATFVPIARSGIAAACANMIITAFGWFFHNSIGMSLEHFWDGKMINGTKYYNSAAYIKSISIIPMAMGVAIVGLFVISVTQYAKSRNTEKLAVE